MKRIDPARILAHELEPGLVALDLRLSALLAEHEVEGLRACLEEVAALRALVRDHQLGIESKPFSMEPVLEALRTRFAPIASARAVSLDVAPGDARAMGDARATERILSNLLSNAISFSPEGDVVVVRVKSADRSIEVAVEDRGVGIRPGDRERIFEPFVRLDPERESAGLGLTLALSLAEAQGGTLTVASATGRGSRFVLTLPAA